MDSISATWLIEIVRAFGFAGFVGVMWYFDSKNFRKMLAQYKSDMDEQRKMYASNVKLVESYDRLAGDLKDVVIMNTQVMTKLVDAINTNQYCPQVRLEKQAKGKQGG